jgi:hypothetical protein
MWQCKEEVLIDFQKDFSWLGNGRGGKNMIFLFEKKIMK